MMCWHVEWYLGNVMTLGSLRTSRRILCVIDGSVLVVALWSKEIHA